jgi:alpha-N-arabinofuranosidase
MFRKASLCSLAVLIGVAAAGAKAPRSPGVTPRTYTNSSGASNLSGVTLNILTKTGVKNATAPDLYGWMFEDINHSGDGGLYGELLTNRAFDGSGVTWHNASGFIGNNIVYQENICEAFGKFIAEDL